MISPCLTTFKLSEVGILGGHCQTMLPREHSTYNRVSIRGLLGWGKGKEEIGRVKDPLPSEDIEEAGRQTDRQTDGQIDSENQQQRNKTKQERQERGL